MANKTNTNRRQYYRYEPPALDAPVLSLVHNGRRYQAASVIDVSLKGVRLVFASQTLPPPVAGAVVTTSIQAAGSAASTDLAGRVVFCFERGEHWMVAIAFSATPDLDDGMTADFFRVFNRRADLRRMLPPGSNQMSALVLNAAGEADAIVDLLLRDHSDQGLGFVVDTRTDAFMRDGASLALPLPDRQQAVSPAQIRRRDAHQGAIHYGCTFDGEHS